MPRSPRQMPAPDDDTVTSQPVSFRLSPDEQRALAARPVTCPTCRQPVTNLNTLARMALRRMLKLDTEEEPQP